MAYTNYKSNEGVTIDNKQTDCSSPKQSSDQNEYYSLIDFADNNITTAGTPSAQQATTDQVPHQLAENVNCDNDVCNMFLFQNLEDSLKHIREAHLANTNEARVSDGTWSYWENWGECSATCNVGMRSRNRTCIGIGQDGLSGFCSGNNLDISICNDKDCNRGFWAQWLNWGECSATCNAGVRRRKRTCNSQNGQQGFCPGNDVDISPCNNEEPGPSDVSFTALLTTTLENVKEGTTVVFDKVVNNDGNAYNPLKGIFTCPTAVKYLFSLTASASKEKTALNIFILIDGNKTMNAISESAFAGHDSTGSADLVTHLNIGQRVWAETSHRNNSYIFKWFTRFLGVLIHR